MHLRDTQPLQSTSFRSGFKRVRALATPKPPQTLLAMWKPGRRPVPLRWGRGGATMRFTWETSPRLLVSKRRRADIGYGWQEAVPGLMPRLGPGLPGCPGVAGNKAGKKGLVPSFQEMPFSERRSRSGERRSTMDRCAGRLGRSLRSWLESVRASKGSGWRKTSSRKGRQCPIGLAP
jgi:hypothetical protein